MWPPLPLARRATELCYFPKLAKQPTNKKRYGPVYAALSFCSVFPNPTLVTDNFRSFVALDTLAIGFTFLSCKTWTGRFGYLGRPVYGELWYRCIGMDLGNLQCPDSGVCAQLLASSSKASHNITYLTGKCHNTGKCHMATTTPHQNVFDHNSMKTELKMIKQKPVKYSRLC